MAILTADEKLEQWKPTVLTKLLGEKKYNFTVEGTKDTNAIRLFIYSQNRLKDQPKFEEKLSRNKNWFCWISYQRFTQRSTCLQLC